MRGDGVVEVPWREGLYELQKREGKGEGKGGERGGRREEGSEAK